MFFSPGQGVLRIVYDKTEGSNVECSFAILFALGRLDGKVEGERIK